MPTFTLANLESYVWDTVDGNSLFFPEPQVRLALNQGLYRLNLLVGFKQAVVPIPGWSVASQYLYSVPSGIVIPLRVEFEQRELQPLSLPSLARKYRTWISDTTANRGPVQHWTALGITQFLIHPADAVGGRLITVTGVAPIAALVAAGDPVDLEDEWMEILVRYAAQRVQLKDSSKSWQDSQATLFREMIEDVGGKILWEARFFPEQFVVRGAR